MINFRLCGNTALDRSMCVFLLASSGPGARSESELHYLASSRPGSCSDLSRGWSVTTSGARFPAVDVHSRCAPSSMEAVNQSTGMAIGFARVASRLPFCKHCHTILYTHSRGSILFLRAINTSIIHCDRCTCVSLRVPVACWG